MSRLLALCLLMPVLGHSGTFKGPGSGRAGKTGTGIGRINATLGGIGSGRSITLGPSATPGLKGTIPMVQTVIPEGAPVSIVSPVPISPEPSLTGKIHGKALPVISLSNPKETITAGPQGRAISDEEDTAPEAPDTRLGARLSSGLSKVLKRLKNPFGPPKIVPDYLSKLEPGQAISFKHKKKAMEGVVVDIRFDEVRIAVRKNDKWEMKNIPYKHLNDIAQLPIGAIEGAESLKISPVRTEGRRLFRRYLKKNHWSAASDKAIEDIASMRALDTKEEITDYVREVGRGIMARIHEAHGTSEIGFHYNLHGGAASQYVDGSGIRASRGDIALQYGHGDPADKVYFFRSSNVELYDVLNERNPNLVSSRMGHVLMLFNAESPEMTKAAEEGGSLKPTAISLDFNTAWLSKNSIGGTAIPYTSFITPPMEIFMGTKKKLGLKGRLSRDEENMTVMRYIEAVALADPSHIPAPRDSP